MAKKAAAGPQEGSQESSTGKVSKEDIAKALMRLAAEEPWDLITLPMIAQEAGLSLAGLREHFPSKGAILGAFAKMIDRQVLSSDMSDMEDQMAKDRLLDVMLKRFDALAPYKEGVRGLRKAIRRSPSLAVALNPTALNSFRYMLAQAGVDTEDHLAPVRIQGAVVLFSRAVEIWLDDEDEGLSKTMAFLDKELDRGIGVMRRIEDLDRIAAPFRGFFRAMGDRKRSRPSMRERMRDRFDEMRDGFNGRRRDRDDDLAERA
jgi:AcrR family transcriptional regulator